MRLPALLLAGAVMIATAHAQSGGTQIEFLPMPKTLPQMLFAPDSLAGTMLRPLDEPADAGESVPADVETAIAPAAATTADARITGALAQADLESAPEMAPDTQTMAAPESFGAQPSEAPPAPAVTTVHVIVENVESDKGTVNVALCDTDLSEEGCPYFTKIPASLGFVEATIDVPPGTYAVVGYHDVNNNDEFDKLLGVPREPYALSGRAAEKMIPGFEDAALPIKQGENFVIIRMKRLGSG